jgi:hypothetical protein
MKLSLASTAELYAEHRRTGSTRKRQRIAAELQRRHDEIMCRPGYGNTWWTWQGPPMGWVRIPRVEFAIVLPLQSAVGNLKSAIRS